MEDALRAKPEDAREQHERQLKDLSHRLAVSLLQILQLPCIDADAKACPLVFNDCM